MRTKAARTALAVTVLLLAAAAAMSADDIARHRSCAECGMDRKAYGYSRMLIAYGDGAEVGTCSLHCTAVVLSRTPGKEPPEIRVADRNTTELVDAAKASWVIGGKKRGVMTKVPKWAFAARPDAEAFLREHGGKVATWDEALAAAASETR
jgi:nitrous oxide reductase accessory protein NosL